MKTAEIADAVTGLMKETEYALSSTPVEFKPGATVKYRGNDSVTVAWTSGGWSYRLDGCRPLERTGVGMGVQANR